MEHWKTWKRDLMGLNLFLHGLNLVSRKLMSYEFNLVYVKREMRLGHQKDSPLLDH